MGKTLKTELQDSYTSEPLGSSSHDNWGTQAWGGALEQENITQTTGHKARGHIAMSYRSPAVLPHIWQAPVLQLLKETTHSKQRGICILIHCSFIGFWGLVFSFLLISSFFQHIFVFLLFFSVILSNSIHLRILYLTFLSSSSFIKFYFFPFAFSYLLHLY